MRRDSTDEAAEAAQRRLALLSRELELSGLTRRPPANGTADLGPAPDEDLEGGLEDGLEGLPSPASIEEAGRHSRRRPAGVMSAASDWAGERVPDTLRGRVELTRGPVRLVVMVAVVALVLSGVMLFRSRGSTEALTPVATDPSAPLITPGGAGLPRPAATTAVGGEVPGAAGAGAPGTATGVVTVDVAGKVVAPGITTLPVGSRVQDAISAAGGAKPGVDLTSLNRARVLIDGEQILVGRFPGGKAAAAASAQTGAPSVTGALVSLNTATAEQLDTLPGVGPVTAKKILDWRSEHGGFTSVDELLDVDGIGEKTLAELAPLVTL